MNNDPIEPEVNADKTDEELRAHQTVNVKAELETASKIPLKPIKFGEKLEKTSKSPLPFIFIGVLVLALVIVGIVLLTNQN